jgi:dihydroneopterin aldolase
VAQRLIRAKGRRALANLPRKCHRRRLPSRRTPHLADSLILEVADFETDVLTGIYSEETGRPQPLRISIQVRMRPIAHYAPETPLSASKNYMDLKFAAAEALPPGVHFKLIEAVADHICETLLLQDSRVEAVTVKIVKLAISENGEKIGMTLTRERR